MLRFVVRAAVALFDLLPRIGAANPKANQLGRLRAELAAVRFTDA
jgi:hypothetical protein